MSQITPQGQENNETIRKFSHFGRRRFSDGPKSYRRLSSSGKITVNTFAVVSALHDFKLEVNEQIDISFSSQETLEIKVWESNFIP